MEDTSTGKTWQHKPYSVAFMHVGDPYIPPFKNDLLVYVRGRIVVNAGYSKAEGPRAGHSKCSEDTTLTNLEHCRVSVVSLRSLNAEETQHSSILPSEWIIIGYFLSKTSERPTIIWLVWSQMADRSSIGGAMCTRALVRTHHFSYSLLHV